MVQFETIVFGLLAVFIIGAAVITAVSRNIIRSAFALLAALAGIAGIFGMIGADLLAVVQVMVYVGGIMVLILFAVMLTNKIQDVNASNRSLPAAPAAGVSLILLAAMLYGIWNGFEQSGEHAVTGATSGIGNAVLSGYAIPFAGASVLMLAALVASVVIARKKSVQENCSKIEEKERGSA